MGTMQADAHRGRGQRIYIEDIPQSRGQGQENHRQESPESPAFPWPTEFAMDRNNKHELLFKNQQRHSMADPAMSPYLLKSNFINDPEKDGEEEEPTPQLGASPSRGFSKFERNKRVDQHRMRSSMDETQGSTLEASSRMKPLLPLTTAGPRYTPGLDGSHLHGRNNHTQQK